jgi:hypothetical protein
MMVEQVYIKEKAATLVVEIAKRDWPQHWDDLLNNLVQISMMGVIISSLPFYSLPSYSLPSYSLPYSLPSLVFKLIQ